MLPGAAYGHEDSCTLLRNPHIARNEELQLSGVSGGRRTAPALPWAISPMWSWCLQTVWQRSGWAAPTTTATSSRLLPIPILNRCVKRNYDYDVYQQLSNNANLPLLKIPSLSRTQVRRQRLAGPVSDGGEHLCRTHRTDLQRRPGPQRHRLQRPRRPGGAQAVPPGLGSPGHLQRVGN